MPGLRRGGHLRRRNEALEFPAGLIASLIGLVGLWARGGKLAYLRPRLLHQSQSAGESSLPTHPSTASFRAEWMVRSLQAANW